MENSDHILLTFTNSAWQMSCTLFIFELLTLLSSSESTRRKFRLSYLILFNCLPVNNLGLKHVAKMYNNKPRMQTFMLHAMYTYIMQHNNVHVPSLINAIRPTNI